jgi:hypothetical protein
MPGGIERKDGTAHLRADIVKEREQAHDGQW